MLFIRFPFLPIEKQNFNTYYFRKATYTVNLKEKSRNYRMTWSNYTKMIAFPSCIDIWLVKMR